MGILAKDGIVMASERRITSGLLAPAKVSFVSLSPPNNKKTNPSLISAHIYA